MIIYSHVAAKAPEAAAATGWHPEGDFWLALALGLVGNGLAAYSAYILRQTLKKQNNNGMPSEIEGDGGRAELTRCRCRDGESRKEIIDGGDGRIFFIFWPTVGESVDGITLWLNGGPGCFS